jgi:hypothetical protein
VILSAIVRLIAFALIFEAMFAGLYVANTIGQLGIYDAVAVTLIVARGLLGALQFAGGWLWPTGARKASSSRNGDSPAVRS